MYMSVYGQAMAWAWGTRRSAFRFTVLPDPALVPVASEAGCLHRTNSVQA
jgi:hypothetical protein